MKHPLATKQKSIRQAKLNGETYYSIVDIIENLTGTIAPLSISVYFTLLFSFFFNFVYF